VSFTQIDYVCSFIYFCLLNPVANRDSGNIAGKTMTPSDIEMEVAVLYKLRPEFVHDLYEKYPGQDYASDFELIIKSAIQTIPSFYKNEDFYEKRKEIAAEMAILVATGNLRNSTQFIDLELQAVYSQLVSLQLISVVLPSSIETTIIDQQVNKRSIETAEIEKEIQVLRIF